MKTKTKTMCSGCRNNFYNGNNSLGISECWLFKDARVVRREEQACRDWHRSAYRTAAERRDAATKRREARLGIVFVLVLAALIVGIKLYE